MDQNMLFLLSPRARSHTGTHIGHGGKVSTSTFCEPAQSNNRTCEHHEKLPTPTLAHTYSMQNRAPDTAEHAQTHLLSQVLLVTLLHLVARRRQVGLERADLLVQRLKLLIARRLPGLVGRDEVEEGYVNTIVG